MKQFIDIIKAAWIILWATICTLVLFIPMMTTARLSRTGNLAFSISRIWAWTMLKVTFVRCSIAGKENIKKGTSYIIISNHQSHFDILAIVTTLGIQFRWIIKKEILKVPLFGHALYASRNIFIDRSNSEKARESINRGVDRISPGTSIIFFAEGTRSPDGNLRAFKKGGFVIAVERGYPILPVTVNGSRKILPKGKIAFIPGRIEVAVGEPITTAGYSVASMDQLIEKTRGSIASKLMTDSL